MFKLGKEKKGHTPDYIFIALTAVLTIFGLIMLSSASSDLGKIRFDDTYYFVKHQIYFGLSLGILGFLAGWFIYYRYWQKLALFLLLISIGALFLVFTPLGLEAGGASRWVNLGPFSFQPAELLKLTFLVYLAAWIGGKQGKRQTSFVEGFLPFALISGVVAVLVLLQPATTTIVILMAASLIVYFLSGAKKSFIALFLFLAILGMTAMICSTSYRMQRVVNFINSDNVSDDLGAGYHRKQAQIAIGVGGLTGVGYGQATTKYKFLPEPIGDSIFAVIAGELGFIGSIFVIILFCTYFMRGFFIAKNCRDQFGRLLVIGFISVIAVQTFINIGAISGVLPLTGVPLPFISYGGTSLAIFLTMSGIIVNISRYT